MPQLVEEYAEVLHAPHKKLVWFERSEHSPSFEESEAFNELLLTEVHRYALEGGTP